MVRIEWRGVDDAGRRELEQRFHLTEPAPLGGALWEYVPRDGSRDTTLALLRHPAVAETDGIDRRRGGISPRAPLTARRGGLIEAAQLARATKAAAYLSLLGGAVLFVVVGARRVGLHRIRPGRLIQRATRSTAATFGRFSGSMRGVLTRGVPVASPESAAAFRVVFGALALWFALIHPASEVHIRGVDVEAAVGLQRAIGVRLLADPSLVAWIDRGVLAFGLLFIVGLVTRLASLGFAIAYLLWACVFTMDVSHHQVSALVVSLLCLSGARAGDAWSVDAWLRRRSGPPPGPSAGYGYVIWIPGFVLGVTFLAAAWSKVGDGPQWILNGTVKYHFATDLNAALVSWGPALTASRPIAVAMSAAAVVVEAAVIAASFARSPAVRLWLGGSAAALLAGFALFQGIIWPTWWLLVLSFLPWPLIGPRGGASSLPRPQRAVIAAVLVVQVAASLRSIEIRPYLSAYDMYSATYASPAEYEASSNLRYRLLVAGADGRESELPGCVLDERAVRRIVDAGSTSQQLSRELSNYECAAPNGGNTVRLVGDRRVFDFSAREFQWRRAVATVGPILVR
jgi:hypothetical protein